MKRQGREENSDRNQDNDLVSSSAASGGNHRTLRDCETMKTITFFKSSEEKEGESLQHVDKYTQKRGENPRKMYNNS